MEPRIVRAVYRDNRRYAVKPKAIRRAVEPATAATLTTIMEAVVTDGTAKAARIDGYSVAGKTGTASKLIDGRYSATENNVSFVGFAPSRKPAIAIIVVIDAPHANGNSGGAVAAPIFSRIAECGDALSRACRRRSIPRRPCWSPATIRRGWLARSAPRRRLSRSCPMPVPR